MVERGDAERVVITGMGTAAPTENGLTPEGFWSDLLAGRHGVRNIEYKIDGYQDVINTRIGAPLQEFVLKEKLDEAGFNTKEPNIHKEARGKWDRTSQAQVWTGSQALRQAGLLTGDSLRVDEKHIDPQRFGVYQGTGVAGFLNLVDIQKILDGVGKRPQVSGYDILQFLGGRPDEVTSMVFNAQRFNDTMYTECAAGLSSIDRAMDDLRLGRADVVLAGGVEIAAHPTTIAAFEATNALTKSTDPNEAPVMFTDPESTPSGLVLGEGGASVVLETLEHAKWRAHKFGAEMVILAEVLGTSKTADAYKDTAPSREGGLRAMRLAWEDARIDTDEVEGLFAEAHATGTGYDIDEFRGIASIFRKRQVVGISSIKVDTGHTFGGAGTLGVIAGIHAMRDNTIPGHRTMSDSNRHPETLGWPLMPGKAQKVRNVGYVMVNSFGFGGKNRVVILGSYQQKAA
jgi:3-oxoacyl-[acyl-carrier-protein] synthase II